MKNIVVLFIIICLSNTAFSQFDLGKEAQPNKGNKID